MSTTKERLIQDILALYERGYVTSEALNNLPVHLGSPVSEEECREVLRRAGYTDAQIETGDYR